MVKVDIYDSLRPTKSLQDEMKQKAM